MWVPRSESEIASAVAGVGLRETATFDAKAQLPPRGRNKDLAKDVCAMTVDGGVLLYGVGGEDPTRPDQLMPVELAGAAERVDQVAQTGIAEAPVIEIHDIAASAQPGRGYLVVVIPASPRAPHMLIIDGDNRFWGRGATGNRRLSEGEVARLYARRERWEVDRAALLERALSDMPFPEGEQAAICLVARPVAASGDVVAAAAGERGADHLLSSLRQAAAAADPYPDQGDSSISDAGRGDRRGADVWVLDPGHAPDAEYGARLELGRDGLLHYWAKPLAHEQRGHFALLERSVTRHVTQFLAVAAELHRSAPLPGIGGRGGRLDRHRACRRRLDAPWISAGDLRRAGLPAERAPEHAGARRRRPSDRGAAARAVVRRHLPRRLRPVRRPRVTSARRGTVEAMLTVLEPIRVQLDGRATPSETTLRQTAPHVVVLTTALPDVPLTVVTTYVGADDVDTTAVDLVLARRPTAERDTRTMPRDAIPVTHARDRCLLDHLGQVHAALERVQPLAVTIDIADQALNAVAG